MKKDRSGKEKKMHESAEGNDAKSKRDRKRKGDPIEEFIDPEISKEDENHEPERTDAMGISKKAKKQASDESDVAKDKK